MCSIQIRSPSQFPRNDLNLQCIIITCFLELILPTDSHPSDTSETTLSYFGGKALLVVSKSRSKKSFKSSLNHFEALILKTKLLSSVTRQVARIMVQAKEMPWFSGRRIQMGTSLYPSTVTEYLEYLACGVLWCFM